MMPGTRILRDLEAMMSDQARSEQDPYCLWLDGEREFDVGVVGAGPGFLSILELAGREEYHEFIPRLRVVAACEAGLDEAKLHHGDAVGLPVFESCEAMLAARPEINLVVELTYRRDRLARLRRELPGHVSLIDHVAAVFLCGLLNMAQVSARCLLNLDRHKAMLAAIIDEVQEDIMLLDKDRRVVDCNKNLARRLDQEKEHILGLPCWQAESLFEGEPFCAPSAADCPVFETLKTGKKAEGLQTRIDPDGRLLYFRIYSYPVFDGRGELTHVLIMRRDITSRTLKEQVAQQSQRLSAIGDMSTFLAHEIRNPLFAIGGFANALLRSPRLDEREREKARIIREEADRLERMLKSFLEFAKPVGGSSGETDLNVVAEEAMELMRGGYVSLSPPIVLETDLAEGLPKAVGDRGLALQCVLNLMKNAVEALPEAGGRVVLRTGMREGFVFIEVEDNGKGMTPEVRDKVFSPFFSTKDKGYGLGLAMIKKNVEDLGGRVELLSRESAGSKVALLLPAVLADGRRKADRS